VHLAPRHFGHGASEVHLFSPALAPLPLNRLTPSPSLLLSSLSHPHNSCVLLGRSTGSRGQGGGPTRDRAWTHSYLRPILAMLLFGEREERSLCAGGQGVSPGRKGVPVCASTAQSTRVRRWPVHRERVFRGIVDTEPAGQVGGVGLGRVEVRREGWGQCRRFLGGQSRQKYSALLCRGHGNQQGRGRAQLKVEVINSKHCVISTLSWVVTSHFCILQREGRGRTDHGDDEVDEECVAHGDDGD
jgi:hypothetical protein